MKKLLQPDRLHAHPVDVPTQPNVVQQMRACDALPPAEIPEADSTVEGLIPRPTVPGEPTCFFAYRTFENTSEEDEPTIIFFPPRVGPTKHELREQEQEGYDNSKETEPEGDLEAIDDLRS